MDMGEVTFQVEFASSFKLATINRALVAAVAVLSLHVTLKRLTCVRLVITFTALQFDLQVRSSDVRLQIGQSCGCEGTGFTFMSDLLMCAAKVSRQRTSVCKVLLTL